ncbi:MAG: hypothetical protein EXS11_00775 [Gemmataceae bacterium]|nr:hypothetical protein [Gemmataceae bacterium]
MDTDRKKQLQALLADFPGDPFIRYGIAMEETSEGNLADASISFERLIADHADYVPAYLQAGQIAARMENPSLARKIYSQGILVAKKARDFKASGEMEQFMDALD